MPAPRARSRSIPGSWANASLTGRTRKRICAVQRIWGGWDATELWAALLLQLELFRRLSREVALALHYSYEDTIFGEIEAYIRRLWRDDSANVPTD